MKSDGNYFVINSYKQKHLAVSKAKSVLEYVNTNDPIPEGDASEADREGDASVFGGVVPVAEEEEEEEE